MVLMGTDIPLMAIRKQIASAIDIIVQLERLRDKSRRVTEITEVVGYEDGEIRLNHYSFLKRWRKTRLKMWFGKRAVMRKLKMKFPDGLYIQETG